MSNKCFWCGVGERLADDPYAPCKECAEKANGRIRVICINDEPFEEDQEPIFYVGNIPMYPKAEIIVVPESFVDSYVENEDARKLVIERRNMFFFEDEFKRIKNLIRENKKNRN